MSNFGYNTMVSILLLKIKTVGSKDEEYKETKSEDNGCHTLLICVYIYM